MRIISTPNGQTNLFHRLWSGSAYSKHFVNIHQAIAQGLPLNAQELQSRMSDPEAWKQEYECQFIDTSAVLLPHDLVRACAPSVSVPQRGDSIGRQSLRELGLRLGLPFRRMHRLCKSIEWWRAHDNA